MVSDLLRCHLAVISSETGIFLIVDYGVFIILHHFWIPSRLLLPHSPEKSLKPFLSKGYSFPFPILGVTRFRYASVKMMLFHSRERILGRLNVNSKKASVFCWVMGRRLSVKQMIWRVITSNEILDYSDTAQVEVSCKMKKFRNRGEQSY